MSQTAGPDLDDSTSQHAQSGHWQRSQLSPHGKRGSGHGSKLGFGSSSHSRIEDTALHGRSASGSMQSVHSQPHHDVHACLQQQQPWQNWSESNTQLGNDAVRSVSQHQPSVNAAIPAVEDQAPQILAPLQRSGTEKVNGSGHSNAAQAKEPRLSPRPSGTQHSQHIAEGSVDQGDAGLFDRTSSLQSHRHKLTARPSFMRPTVSSLVHTASLQRSLRKSKSAVEVYS